MKDWGSIVSLIVDVCLFLCLWDRYGVHLNKCNKNVRSGRQK